LSSDGGAVWTQIDSMWYNEGGCVLVHPESANVVITGGQTEPGYFGVSVSRDSGMTWTRFTLWSSYADFCYSLAIAPSQPRVVYAGGRGSFAGIVFRSTDLGGSWQRTASAPAYDVFGLAVHPNDAATVIAASAGGIYRTTDSGTNWTQVDSTLGFHSVRFLDGYDVAAGGDSGVVFSTDGGADWYDICAGPEGAGISCLDFLEPPENSMIVGTHGASCWLWDPDAGLQETMNDGRETMTACATVVRGMLSLGADSRQHSAYRADLLDAAGRSVMRLQAGANDVSRLAPGVYFAREQSASSRQHSGIVHKVVIAR